MQVEKIETMSVLDSLKEQYMSQTTAPLDGMWLTGFVPSAHHYGFREQGEWVGFYCLNEDGHLLQFLVDAGHRQQASAWFGALLRADGHPHGAGTGAFVSTAEPHYLSLCLDHFSAFEVNALMYQRDPAAVAGLDDRGEDGPPLEVLGSHQLAEAVSFAVQNIGAPAEWLTGYYGNLIQRGELFGVWDDGRLIATGESRGYDRYQLDCADLGVIVAEGERGKGLATHVLRRLAAANDARGLRSICSTERENLGAQKAIARAGFFARDRILRFRGS